MFIGQAYTNVLTSDEQQALQESCDLLIDSAFDDFQDIENPEDIDGTLIGMYLPRRYLYKYTPLFFKKFAVCLITAIWKLAQPQPMPLSSVAEELAVWVLVQEAKRHLEDETASKVEDAFETFIDTYFEDADFEFLYDATYDGIEETELAKKMNISNLAFTDWFIPFSDQPSRIPHPYVTE